MKKSVLIVRPIAYDCTMLEFVTSQIKKGIDRGFIVCDGSFNVEQVQIDIEEPVIINARNAE